MTLNFRYLVNDTYAKGSKSPILFYTGNEGDIELFAQNTGFMWEIAPKLGATLVFAEHRYYGKSLPFGDKSYDSSQHLGYLTSEQALADFSLLLDSINSINSTSLAEKKRPVIVSYQHFANPILYSSHKQFFVFRRSVDRMVECWQLGFV